MKISESQVEVNYIDFGNSETVESSSVRKPKTFCKSLPAQAMRCGLSGFELPQNEDQAKQILVAFVELVSLAMPVKLRSVVKSIKDDVVMLEVFSAQENKSVNNELSMLCKDKSEAKTDDVSVETASVTGHEAAKHIPERQLPLDDTILALVIEIYSNESFYVQLLDDALKNKLETIMRELNEYCNSIGVVADGLQVGDCVAAKFTDGVWYRAKVKKPVSSDKVTVLYVDFGNTETVSKDMVKQLDAKFANVPAMAVHCELLGSQGHDKQLTEDFKCMLNQTVNVKAVLQKKDVHTVELLLPNSDAGSVNALLGLDSKLPDSDGVPLPSLSREETTIPVFSLPLDGSRVAAMVVDVQRLDHFFIQLAEEKYTRELASLMEELNKSCANDTKPYVPKDGEAIAAQFNDGASLLWYRAQSLGQDASSNDKFWVQFVDYGNKELVTKEMIRVLEPQFVKHPAKGVTCKLIGSTGNESAEKIEEFKSVMYQPVPLKIRALSLKSNVYEIEMFLDSEKLEKTDISEILGLRQPSTQLQTPTTEVCPPSVITNTKSAPTSTEAKKQVISPVLQCAALPSDGSSVKGSVIVIESFQSFYVQLQELQQKLGQMMQELNKSDVSLTNPHESRVGEVVAAQYTESGLTMWYRARVEKIEAGKIQVFFVDYGNTEHVKKEEVHKLDEKFLGVPQMAVKCKLSGSTGNETTELLKEFAVVLNKSLLIKSKNCSGGVYEIDLLLDNGMSVSDMLALSAQSSPDLATIGSDMPNKTVSDTKQDKSGARVQKELECCKLALDGSTLPAAIMAIESLQCFTVQVLSKELQDNLTAVMLELNECCKTAVRPYSPAIREIVAAQYTENDHALWYRARVNERLGENFEVTFIDYGNTEIVGKSEICQLDDKFLTFPQVTVKCKLAGCTGDDPQLLKEFELILKLQLLLKASSYSDGVYTVEFLTNDGVSINEQLGFTSASGSQTVSPTTATTKPPQVKSDTPKQEALPRKSMSPQQAPVAERKVVFTQTLPRHIPEVKEFKLMITSVTSPASFHSQMMDPEHDCKLLSSSICIALSVQMYLKA